MTLVLERVVDPAVDAHAAHNFAAAADLRADRLAGMSFADPEFPGLAGAYALALERQPGRHGDALQWADAATRPLIRAQVAGTEFMQPDGSYNMPAVFRAVGRRHPDVAINTGTVFANEEPALHRVGLADHAAVRRRQVSNMYEGAWDTVGFHDLFEPPKQHGINLIARYAMDCAVERRVLASFGYAIGAILLSPFSEARMFTGGTSGLARGEAYLSRAKALARGVGSLMVATAAVPNTRPTNALRDKLRRIFS